MKPFTTSLLGSMPRSQVLLMARKKHALGKITTTELEQIVVQETKQIVALQQRTGFYCTKNSRRDLNEHE